MSIGGMGGPMQPFDAGAIGRTGKVDKTEAKAGTSFAQKLSDTFPSTNDVAKKLDEGKSPSPELLGQIIHGNPSNGQELVARLKLEEFRPS